MAFFSVCGFRTPVIHTLPALERRGSKRGDERALSTLSAHKIQGTEHTERNVVCTPFARKVYTHKGKLGLMVEGQCRASECATCFVLVRLPK